MGNSLGRKRHWQPVRSRYNTAQNTSYRSIEAGLVRRRTLRSKGSISANFSRLMSLAYFFLFTCALSLCAKGDRKHVLSETQFMIGYGPRKGVQSHTKWARLGVSQGCEY